MKLLICLLCSCFLLMPNALVSKAMAASGEGRIEATILDPLTMNYGEAKRLCEDDPYLMKCELLKERIKEEKKNNNDDNTTTNESISGQTSNDSIIYDITTANFE